MSDQQSSNMQLDDFVSEVLKQIINGVKNAQQYAKDNGAHINSNRIYRSTTGGDLKMDLSDHGGFAQEIDFDVAVTVSAQGSLKGGMGLFIPAAGIGYQAEKETNNSIVSRIKFKIPVTFPFQG